MIPTARRRRQSGVSLIEYSFAWSIFILLVFGFIDFSLIVFGYNNATYASRVAVRYAVLHGNSASYTCTRSDISNVVTSLLWIAPAGGATVQTNWSPDNSPGSTVSITVSIQYNTFIPFFKSRTVSVGTTAYATILE